MPLVNRILVSRNPRPLSGLCPRTGDPCIHAVTPRGCRNAVLDTDHYYAETGISRLLRPATVAEQLLTEQRMNAATRSTLAATRDAAQGGVSAHRRGTVGRPGWWV